MSDPQRAWLTASDFSVAEGRPIILGLCGTVPFTVATVSFGFYYFIVDFFDLAKRPCSIRQAQAVRWAYFYLLLREGLEPTPWLNLSRSQQKQIRMDLKQIISDGFKCWLIEYDGFTQDRWRHYNVFVKHGELYYQDVGEDVVRTGKEWLNKQFSVRTKNQKGHTPYSCNLVANQLRRDRYITGKARWDNEACFARQAAVYPPFTLQFSPTRKAS